MPGVNMPQGQQQKTSLTDVLGAAKTIYDMKQGMGTKPPAQQPLAGSTAPAPQIDQPMSTEAVDRRIKMSLGQNGNASLSRTTGGY